MNQKIRFVHTADWHLGKPFGRVDDVQKCSLLQQERIAVIRRIGEIARVQRAEFVLVAGDLFDSPNATKATVAAACAAIGSIGVPVYAIPGNHDHGGAGSLWGQDYFQREHAQLAPNFHIQLKPEPVKLDNAVLFPCPLLRQHETADPTAWLRSEQDLDARFGDKPRIVLAHGSVQNFGSSADDEESEEGAHNMIELPRLPERAFDYIALGDWHGTKQVAPQAWYSGTPELDRFVRGADNNPGNILVVEAGRSEPPQVQCVRSGAIGWHEIEFSFADDAGLVRFQELVAEKVGNRVNQDLIHLHLRGALGIEASAELERLIDASNARLLRVKLDKQTVLAPSPAELDGLTRRANDPLVSRVAAKLVALTEGHGESAEEARIALRELHMACNAD